MNHRKLLVLCTPHAGSRYFAKVMQDAGFDFEHEGLGRDGGITQAWVVDETNHPRAWRTEMFKKHGPPDLRQFDHVWHLVRHPLYCIRTLRHARPEAYWLWAEHFARTKMPAGFYVRWNMFVESRNSPDLRIRVEDLEKDWPRLMAELDMEDTAFPGTEPGTGHSKKVENQYLALRMIEHAWREEVEYMGKRYGYDMEIE